MGMYKAKHIQPNTIATVPIQGYINRTNYSADSIRWLDSVAATENIVIQHALNGNGEKKIRGISVDGYCESTKTIYQFHVSIFNL